MDSETNQDSQALLPQLAEVREKLDGLVADLRGAEAELAALAPQREQHGLVSDACDALEKLRATGGAGLFWGERDASAADEQLRRARDRSNVFAEASRRHRGQAPVADRADPRARVPGRDHRGRPVRSPGRGGAAQARLDHRARAQGAAGARAGHAVDAPRRGRPALPQVAGGFAALLHAACHRIPDDRPAPARCRRSREGTGPHRAHAGQGAAEAARAGAPGNQAAGGSEACRAAGREAEAEAGGRRTRCSRKRLQPRRPNRNRSRASSRSARSWRPSRTRA